MASSFKIHGTHGHPRRQKAGLIQIYCAVCGDRLRANFHYKSDNGIKYLHRLKTGHNNFVEVHRQSSVRIDQ